MSENPKLLTDEQLYTIYRLTTANRYCVRTVIDAATPLIRAEERVAAKEWLIQVYTEHQQRFGQLLPRYQCNRCGLALRTAYGQGLAPTESGMSDLRRER